MIGWIAAAFLVGFITGMATVLIVGLKMQNRKNVA